MLKGDSGKRDSKVQSWGIINKKSFGGKCLDSDGLEKCWNLETCWTWHSSIFLVSWHIYLLQKSVSKYTSQLGKWCPIARLLLLEPEPSHSCPLHHQRWFFSLSHPWAPRKAPKIQTRKKVLLKTTLLFPRIHFPFGDSLQEHFHF